MIDNLWSVEIVASVAEGLQEPGADPASDDRRRAGPRMETLAAGGWRPPDPRK